MTHYSKAFMERHAIHNYIVYKALQSNKTLYKADDFKQKKNKKFHASQFILVFKWLITNYTTVTEFLIYKYTLCILHFIRKL